MDTHRWLQLKFGLGRLDPETVEVALLAIGAHAVTLEDAADDPIYEPGPGETPLWPDTRIAALFDGDADPEVLHAHLVAELGLDALPPHEFITLGDRDWATAWLRDFKPMCFGKRLWVIPGGQTPPDPGAVNILLDPGLAFGTGTHATTALCLDWLAEGVDLGGVRLVDYGCGSGILAIAAALLGADAVIAVDNDPQALTATRENAARNAVADRIQVLAPDEVPASWGATHLVANILAAPLVDLAPVFRDLLDNGGRLALSGLIESQSDTVADAYRAWCRLRAPVTLEGWVRLDGVKVD